MPSIPRSRLSRTLRFGGMMAGAYRRRDDPAAVADELVTRLGQMKGAAMKLGQALSTVDFELIPEGEREAFKERLAALRDDAPKAPFSALRGLVERELGRPLGEVFADFGEEAVAAASIGQVHRAMTRDGRDVAVKVQYPGVAEAVETDLRNIGLLLPLVRRLAPGLDAKAIAREVRDRVGEELDYELEAQNQRAVARAFRGHPDIRVPEVDTRLSTRRVLVMEFVEGAPFGHVKALGEAERDRFAEVAFRFFYGLLAHERLALGDPHPGNYLLQPDGRVAFLDFGLMRKVDAAHLAGERALARAVVAGDAAQAHRWMAELGYLPKPDGFDAGHLLEQLTAAGEWYFRTGFHRLGPEYVRASMEVASSPRSPYFAQMRRQTVPAQALLIRRMESMLFSVLGELRAGADWGRLALEYIAGEAPSTPLGERDAAHWGARTKEA